MKKWFDTLFGWMSISARHDRPTQIRPRTESDYELRLRQLEERSGRLFLP
jgi:hypothetical protein